MASHRPGPLARSQRQVLAAEHPRKRFEKVAANVAFSGSERSSMYQFCFSHAPTRCRP
jgi:hypothetical protein